MSRADLEVRPTESLCGLVEEFGVSAFYRRAEEILEIASAGDGGLGDTLLVLDRQGGFRMLEPTGWSVAAVAAEYGAEAVYKVQRRGASVRVEGWDGARRCLLEGESSGGAVSPQISNCGPGISDPRLRLTA
jgi:hypothetical protein